MDARPEQDVVPYRDGEWVGALEHHANLLSHLDELHTLAEDVVLQNLDAPRGPHVAQTLHNAVAGPEQGGFFTTQIIG